MLDMVIFNDYFMPHGHCYLWRPDILWTHVVSDIIIALAYISIPLSIAIILKKNKKVPEWSIAALAAAFIVLCGFTHLFSIFVIWYPAYEVQAYLKGMTAAVSIVTAVVIIFKLPQLINISKSHSSEETSAAVVVKGLDVGIKREEYIAELKREVNALRSELGRDRKFEL